MDQSGSLDGFDDADRSIDGLIDQSEFVRRCRGDGEFAQATRRLSGGFRFGIGDRVVGVTLGDGDAVDAVPDPGPGVIVLSGSAEAWAPMLASPPEPMATNAFTLAARGQLAIDTDPLTMWQHMAALERAVELLRAPDPDRATRVAETATSGTHDSPVGRYVHVEFGGVDHRIYYESAGTGIPLLMQHTAGANGLQYRHLFEMPEITDHFQLIAYDLPFHGKSIPPVGLRWWDHEYKLTGEFLRSVPVALAQALGLDRPVFMGCSVGGLLALDLALHHPDAFRAVISLEGALRIGGDWDQLWGMHDPRVSNMAKAKMMEGLCSPTSPEPYVKEVSQVYSAGWPPAFVGDLWYYVVDYDLRERAGEIDTGRCAVHILSGEYDHSGTPEHGRVAHQAIAGSTHTVMADIGHFPMQENPARFAQYLLAVLADVKGLA